MAAGLPVVATDVGGVREAIVEGETGYIVASRDDERMAQRIIQVLADDERPRDGLWQRIVAEKFSSEHHLRNTLELYDERCASPDQLDTVRMLKPSGTSPDR
jgi:glycosyltransferase involved in cell wall biosynthesis